jgi:hypothetical protein
VRLRRLDLIVANGLVEKGLGVLVDQALAHDHAGGLAEVAGDPAAAELFGDGGGGAGAAEEVGNKISLFEDALMILSSIASELFL